MAYTKKTINEISNNILLNLVQNVDEINDVNVGSVMSVLVTSLSQEFAEQYDDMETIYNGTILSTSTGDELDNLGAIVGVNRGSGDNAEGYVTFIRNNPATSDFTIAQGTIISTQPNTGEEVYNFNVKDDTVFHTSISNEERTFINGVYEYSFDQRLIDSITSLTGTGGPFIENTDYSLSENYDAYIINTETLENLDTCEVTTGWTAVGADTGAITTSTTHYQGTASLDLTKSGTTLTTFGYEKTLGATVNLEDLKYQFMSILPSTSLLNDLTQLKLWIGSGSGTTHSYEFTYNNDDLTADVWNRLVMNIRDVNTIINGNPQIDLINHLKIEVTLSATSDTVTSGNCLMDFWFGADKDSYSGTILQWDRTATIPTNNTTVTTSYIPLSQEVYCLAADVGEAYNVAKDKIIYKVTNLPNVDSVTNYETFAGGIDVETDAEYRSRIVEASDLANKATSASIKANVEALTFVKSASVDNMPEESTTNETHVYSNTTNKYSLIDKVPIDDINLSVVGTLSGTAGHTFVKTTDYILNSDGDIEFGQGGDNPDDGTITYTDYHYDKLGHFDLLVAGELGNLTSSQLNDVIDTVDDTISVGVTYTINQPTYTGVSVTVTLTIDSAYNTSTVNAHVEDAIKSYIKDLEIGDDVLLAGVINVAMDVEGVDNMVVNDIGGAGSNDYPIATDEIAVPGLITIN